MCGQIVGVSPPLQSGFGPSKIRDRANRVQARSFAKAAKFEPVPHLRTGALLGTV